MKFPAPEDSSANGTLSIALTVLAFDRSDDDRAGLAAHRRCENIEPWRKITTGALGLDLSLHLFELDLSKITTGALGPDLSSRFFELDHSKITTRALGPDLSLQCFGLDLSKITTGTLGPDLS
eukprot:5609416-Pyramimonas_sp.AAC.1